MYLKSLVLKGFKTFADRTVISLEPGITAVVGPNGSGKSNISDAIMWVLGEQSAKQLRGQAMEDVIFSGSSARKPAGVAEVSLVLDNSDGVLPLEFTEIEVTRRMYRNGESEYLINGSPALLRDILDLLHDTGIGRGTHSIIPQGALTAVVEGKPESRRDLIEEAAGILKHKKRKERSARKIAAMDVNLERVRAIAREVNRQLRPLERQAARAREFNGYDSERRELELQLAVDDLRNLQADWEGMQKSVREAEAEIEFARLHYLDKSDELTKLQKTLEEKGLFVGDLTEQRNRCQFLLERVDANRHLLEEKGRNMVSQASELATTVQKSRARLAEARSSVEQCRAEAAEVTASYELYVKENNELNQQSNRLRQERNKANDEYKRLTTQLRNKRRSVDEARLALEKSRQTISSHTLQQDMLSRRIAQIDEQTGTSQNALSQRRGELATLEEKLGNARVASEQAEADIAHHTRVLETARHDLEVARDRAAALRAEIRGIDEIDRAFEAASPALSWVLTHEGEFDVSLRPISDMIHAPAELEPLVERLLGADIFGLVVDDLESAALIASRLLQDTDGRGELSFVPSRTGNVMRMELETGNRLVDELSFDDADTAAVEALLGDVYLVDSLDQAVEAWNGGMSSARYATPDGAVVWPSGKVTLGFQSNDVEGVMARHRRLETLRHELDNATVQLDNAQLRITEAEQTVKAAQSAGFDLSSTIAQLTGTWDSTRGDVGRLEQSLTSLTSERAEVTRQLEDIRSKAASTEPLIEEYEQRIATLEADCADLDEQLAAGADERARHARENNEIVEKIQTCKVGLATANTKSVYLRQRVTTLEKEVCDLENTIEVSTRTQASLAVLIGRIDPLYARLDEIADGVKVWASKIRDQAQLEQSDSASLKETIERAREAVARAKDDLDRKVAGVSDLRIETGKLEIQVKQAVEKIVGEGDILLEEALTIPSPEDRAAAEDRLVKLKRNIASIGPVNQVAMEEYAELKERHDYIQSQVDDLEGARKALAKIDAAIDRKMRARFLETYQEVDASFQSIFQQLFNGGEAHLEFVDPDNPDTSGINIVAQPPGKRVLKNSLMSGGEKSLSALALLFAVYRIRLVPFYVLDEVEVALDDINMRRLVSYLDSMRDMTQFILITHQRRSMEVADVLYGVSMQGDGVSKVVSQRLERAIAEYAEDGPGNDGGTAMGEGAAVRPASPVRNQTRGVR